MKEIHNPKEPWLSVVLSFFFPGIGQIYSGRILRGSILIFTEFTLLCLSIWSWLSPRGDILISVGLLLAFAIVRIWNFFDAYKCARKKNSEQFEDERKLSKEPWLALFLSDLIPGLGHLYLRKWFWGIMFIIVGVSLFAVAYKYPLLQIGLWAFFSMFVCYHAYVLVPIRRQKSYRTITIISFAILLSHLCHYNRYIFKEYVAEAFRLPTNAMTPTLVPGDRILVRKSNKYISKRGDIVVFKSPEEPNIPYIKRIAALSGETIEIKNKILFINGQKVKWPTIETPEYDLDKFGVEEPYKVPENCFFVLGDNSANSHDSRYFGSIPLSDLIGKAYKIYWPLSRRGPIE